MAQSHGVNLNGLSKTTSGRRPFEIGATKTEISERFASDCTLADSIRRLLEDPVWHFLAVQSRKQQCFFCGKKEVTASLRLGLRSLLRKAIRSAMA